MGMNRWLGFAVGVGAAFALMAPAASAATTAGNAEVAAINGIGDPVPSCVKITVHSQRRVTTRNDCGRTLVYKARFHDAVDPTCKTASPGEGHVWVSTWPGKFDKVVSC